MNVRDDFLLYNNKEINKNVLLSAKSKRRMRKSKSDNTLKSYAADCSIFKQFSLRKLYLSCHIAKKKLPVAIFYEKFTFVYSTKIQ